MVINLTLIRYVFGFNSKAYHNVTLESCNSVITYTPSEKENNLIYKLPRNHSAYDAPAEIIVVPGITVHNKGYSSSPDLSHINWYHVRYFANNNLAVTVPAKSMFSNIMDLSRRREDAQCYNKCDKLPPKDPVTKKLDNPSLALTHGDLIDTIVNAKRVLVMRDPFDRLLSAYYNSFEHPGIYAGNCCQVKKGTCADNVDGKKEYKSCSLKEFIIQLSRDASNDHMRSQIEASHFDVIYYHHIIRVSTMSDVECLFALLGEKYEGGHNESPNSSIDVAQKAGYFDLEMVEIMRTIYRNDILLWKLIQSFPGAKPSVMNYLSY